MSSVRCKSLPLRQCTFQCHRRWLQTAATHQARQEASSSIATGSSVRPIYPPESPKFVSIPQPVQPQSSNPFIVKGVLPVPRKIHPENHEVRTPRSSPPKQYHDPLTAKRMTHKARQAALRRENLRASLVELQLRKTRHDRRMAARAAARAADIQARRDAPEREDDALTRATVLRNDADVGVGNARRARLRSITAEQQEYRRQLLAFRKAQTQRNVQAHAAVKLDALHSIYVNAGDFITKESQLDAAIEAAFDNPDQFTSDSARGGNIWNLGVPETTGELLADKNVQVQGARSVKGMVRRMRDTGVVKGRLRKIGEELTGGSN